MEDIGLRALHIRVAGIDVHRMLHVVTVLIEAGRPACCVDQPAQALARQWLKAGACGRPGRSRSAQRSHEQGDAR